MNRTETHYDVLGVPRSATVEEIRHAYRTLSARYHPDRHGDNPLAGLAGEKMARLNEAWAVLSNPARRAAYDAMLRGDPPVAGPSFPLGRWVRRLAIAAVVLLVTLRVLPILLRLVVRVLAATRGTPFLILVTVLLLGGAVLWLRRRRRVQKSEGAPSPNE